MTDQITNKLGRREFLGAAAAASFMILKPQHVRGTAANSQVRFGILGCGGRATAKGTSFVQNADARVTAIADLFADQLEKGRQHFDTLQQAKGYAAIDPSQLFKGPNAYKEIAASKEVDFILITTPPYFHPHHLETVVAAGKHVYCEKPVAIDIPGAHHVISIGEKAKGKLSLAVGFQIRNAPPMVELTRRIHAGDLGKIGCGLAYYYCAHIDRPEWPNASPQEARLRNWVWDRKLSGDIIVEQNIHVIDMCNWMLKGHPIKAVGMCDRKDRTDAGDCKDNFNVLFTYPDNVQISFGSAQFGHPNFDAAVQLFGADGSSEAHYDWRVNIAGKNKWDAGMKPSGAEEFSAAGKFKGALDDADSEKEKAFVASITSGQFLNQAALGAESVMSGILGRTAAYTGRSITWDELQKSKEVLEPGIDITKFA
ncbi:MAG: Gfo/Idh/MocA family oxidoreductase [Acidobacteriota bacterium]|nr:Gfo/Idh/MocA family oxidoreductase [Acidobacteriota bacterium]